MSGTTGETKREEGQMPEEALDYEVYLIGLKLENLAKQAGHPTTQEGLTKHLRDWLDKFPPFQQTQWIMEGKYEATIAACNQLDKVPDKDSHTVRFAAKVQAIPHRDYWKKMHERVEKKAHDAMDDYWQAHHQANAMRTQLEKELWDVYRTTYLHEEVPEDPKVLKDEKTGGAGIISLDEDSIPPLIESEEDPSITLTTIK